MPSFIPVSGMIISLEVFSTSKNTACSIIIGLRSSNQELTYFILDLKTYFVNQVTLKKGDWITAYYDASLPVILIYPPQYRAVVIAKKSRSYFVKVDSFNENLISSDGQLKLQPTNQTQVLLPNNQLYLGPLANQNLVVLYGRSTKSIPALTTPYEIIVLCDQ